MRWLLFLALVSGCLFAATVDTALYEGEQKEAHYKEIAQQIEEAAKSGQSSAEIVQEETLFLARVRSAASQSVTIERYSLKAFSNGSIALDAYYEGLNAAATLRIKQETQQRLVRDIQSKLTFLKQAIERMTEEEKPQLLSLQLQFAYYKLQQKNIEAKKGLLAEHEREVTAALMRSISQLQCGEASTSDEKLAEADKAIERAQQRRVAQQIDLERAEIEESSRKEQLLRKLDEVNAQYQKALGSRLAVQSQRALCTLHEHRNKEFFRLLGEIETAAAELPGELRPLYVEQTAILRELAKEVFGRTGLLVGATAQQGAELLTTVKEYLVSPLFVFNERPVSLLSLLKALILIILGFMAGRFYKRWVARMALRWPDMSLMSIRLASNIGYYLIVIIALMIALSSIGIDMTSISLIAGALSIGIGFGLQTVVSNLIAGIILMFERTIRIGDTIEISDVLLGRVTDMRIRSTTVRTFDNIDIVVPNSSFIQNNVINWTLEDRTRRLRIPFGVAYGTEAEVVKRVILEALEQSDLNYLRNDPEKAPQVWMMAMGSSSVDFDLLVWVEWDNKLRPNAIRSDFLILIYNTLNTHGISIPFPQLDLYVKELPGATPPKE